MKILKLFFLIQILALNIVFAQSFFTDGLIIVAPGDTLHGLVDSRSDLENTKTCNFKATVNSEIVTYKPFEIEGFRYNRSGRLFISKRIKVNSNPEELFVEWLVDGVINLYYYVDIVTNHFLLEMPDGEIQELSNSETNYKKAGLEYARTSKRYIGILKAALKDTPDLYPDIDALEFKKSELIKLLVLYHEAIGEPDNFTIFEKKAKASISVTLYGDYSFVKGKWSGTNEDLQAIFSLTKFAGAGGFMEFIPAKYNGRYYIRTGFNYSIQEYYGETYKKNISADLYFQSTINLKVTGLSVGTGLYFPFQKIKFFLGANAMPIFGEMEVFTSRQIEVNDIISDPEDYDRGIFTINFVGSSFSLQGGFNYEISQKLGVCFAGDLRHYRTYKQREYKSVSGSFLFDEKVITNGPGLQFGVKYNF